MHFSQKYFAGILVWFCDTLHDFLGKISSLDFFLQFLEFFCNSLKFMLKIFGFWPKLFSFEIFCWDIKFSAEIFGPWPKSNFLEIFAQIFGFLTQIICLKYFFWNIWIYTYIIFSNSRCEFYRKNLANLENLLNQTNFHKQ